MGRAGGRIAKDLPLRGGKGTRRCAGQTAVCDGLAVAGDGTEAK